MVHRRGPWRGLEAVEYATLDWVDWFNRPRLLKPIGNIPPAQAEANFYAAMETKVMAAQPGPTGLRQTRRGSPCPVPPRRVRGPWPPRNRGAGMGLIAACGLQLWPILQDLNQLRAFQKLDLLLRIKSRTPS